MSFSKYAVEKKQVSLDMGVTWQDAVPIETRNGRLLGTYMTLVECENADCDLQKLGVKFIDEKIPSIICTHVNSTSGDSKSYDTYLPSGIAKSVTFVSGMKYCGDTWGSSDNIITDEYNNSSITAKTATITTDSNPIREYNSYVLDGREMISGSFCGEATCYNITEFMPWIDPNGTVKMAYTVRYVREHCSDEWKIDEEYTPQFITFGERWVKTFDGINKATWQHQIATDVVSDSGDLGWKVVWENEGEAFDYEYEVTVPQDVELIEYLRADGVAASSSGWTDSYKMKVKIDPTNLGTPTGYLAHKRACSKNEPICYWTMLNQEIEGVTSYYVNVNTYHGNLLFRDTIELTPNEWKYIDIGVVDGATLSGLFCQLKISGSCSKPTVIDNSGYTLNNTYVGGLIRNDGHMYFPYKIPSNLGWEDEYLNASEYGFIDREGDKIPLEYVYAKYMNTNGVTQNLKHYKYNIEDTKLLGEIGTVDKAVGVVFSNIFTSLPIGVCSGNSALVSVDMDSVISIGDNAFSNCYQLKYVNIPSTVTKIGRNAFIDCESLKRVDIPSSVTEIGVNAFKGCTRLTGVTFGSGLTNITTSMFSGCTSLTDVVIPSNITNIDEDAFAYCTSLTSLTLDEGVSIIHLGAFTNCKIEYLTIRSAKPPILYKEDDNYLRRVFTFASDAVIFVPCEAVDTYKNSINWQSASSMIHPIPNEYRWVSYRYTCIDGMKYLEEKKQGRNTACGDDTWHYVGETRVIGGVIKCGEPDYIYRDSSHKGFISDLGVTLKDDTKIEIKLRPTDYGGDVVNNGRDMIIGEVNSPSNNDDYRVFWGYKSLYYDYGSDRLNSSRDSAINTDYVLEIGNYYIKDLISGDYIIKGYVKSGVATAHTRTLGLFGDVKYDYARIYYIKIYEGDTLVKYFIPAKLEDGSGTLYDAVSKTYCSVSNGTFGIYTE